MAALLEKIEHDALRLSVQERAFLADRLLSSLYVEDLNDIDAAWLDEVERRYQEYKDGKRPGIAAQEVFAEADRMLQK